MEDQLKLRGHPSAQQVSYSIDPLSLYYSIHSIYLSVSFELRGCETLKAVFNESQMSWFVVTTLQMDSLPNHHRRIASPAFNMDSLYLSDIILKLLN